MKDLKIFIKGETIDLCKPTIKFAKESSWYSWFNKDYIVRYLSHHYKEKNNTPKKQVEFLRSTKKNRFILILRTKDKLYKGVVSLSFIDNKTKTCDIAVVTDVNIDPKNSPYAPLEAVARLTQYAFDNMKMKKISGAAVFALRKWQQRMELFGYKIETLKFDRYAINSELYNLHYVSCTYEDYLKIKKNRSGFFWDDLKKMKIRIAKLPKITFRDRLVDFMKKRRDKYYNKLFSI